MYDEGTLKAVSGAVVVLNLIIQISEIHFMVHYNGMSPFKKKI